MSSDSESEATTIVDFEDDSEEVIHRLHATHRPFVLACCVEFLFCVMLTSWMSDSEHYTVFFRLHERKIGSQSVVVFVWVVFGVSVFFRLWCLGWLDGSSKEKILAREAGRHVTAGYMFFGTVNWLLYLTAYYVSYDAASNVIKTNHVHIDLARGDPLTAKMKVCLLSHSWNYLECDMHLKTSCVMPYNATAKYANGDCVSTVQVDGISCCISETLHIDRPHLELFGIEIRVSIVFMLIQWMSILLVGWVLRHGFFAAGTEDFSKTAYLDILDCVIFSENLNENLIRNPGYGISRTGRPQERNPWPYYSLYFTFATAFATVLLAQILYTFLVPSEEKEESESVQRDPGEVVLVSVPDSETVGSHRDERSRSLLYLGFSGLRTGQVLECSRPGVYRIRFADGLEPSEAEVALEKLTAPNPDITVQRLQSKLNHAAEKGCSGWLATQKLCHGTPAERFKRKAQLLDAMRSLMCLNLPFLLWRLYFDAFQVDMITFAGRGLLVAKNTIWVVYNCVKLFACLNEDASIFGFKPIQAFSLVADTKFGKLWVGPSGMVALVAEFAGMMLRRKLDKQEHRLQKYRNWLLAEEKGCDGNLKDVYDEKLKDVDHELDVTREKMQFVFP